MVTRTKILRCAQNDKGLAILATVLFPIIVASLTLFLQVSPSFAAGPPVAFSRAEVSDAFPTELTFSTEVTSTVPIQEVDFDYRIGDDPVISTGPAAYTPGVPGLARYVLNIQNNSIPIPPGVTLHFEWAVVDRSGQRDTTDWVDYKLVDPRFSWQSKAGQNLTVYWYDGDATFGQAMLTAAQQGLAQAMQTTGRNNAEAINVYLYANQQDYQSSLGPASPSWVGGTAYPQYGVVTIPAPNDPSVQADVEATLDEELTHIVLDQTKGSPFGHLPTWLDEGLAVRNMGQLEPAMASALQNNVKNNTLYPIRSLGGNFPRDPNDALLAYAESETFVAYMAQTQGQPKVQALVANYLDGQATDDAFQHAMGTSLETIQNQWYVSLGVKNPTEPGAPGSGGPLQSIRNAFTSLLRALHLAS